LGSKTERISNDNTFVYVVTKADGSSQFSDSIAFTKGSSPQTKIRLVGHHPGTAQKPDVLASEPTVASVSNEHYIPV
jgi:hypothetical protein